MCFRSPLGIDFFFLIVSDFMRSDVIRNKSMGKNLFNSDLCYLDDAFSGIHRKRFLYVLCVCVCVCVSMQFIIGFVSCVFYFFHSDSFVCNRSYQNVVYRANVHCTCLLPYRLNVEQHRQKIVSEARNESENKPPANGKGHGKHHQINSI